MVSVRVATVADRISGVGHAPAANRNDDIGAGGFVRKAPPDIYLSACLSGISSKRLKITVRLSLKGRGTDWATFRILT
ncbi:hypothetical protein EVAR_87450_1 [Eumeta japonica]|uniref:Uncharacterized protein n=1 Tax=Eumeta variegata TaxID=151549 RepID=A0A4C1VXK8_EUMVA|nr:hypothetical protein EVAR_87450_1 [Eumeta japonica]